MYFKVVLLVSCLVYVPASIRLCEAHCKYWNAAYFFFLSFLPPQEKLAKSIHYLISKEDQVRTQITELEVLINKTEVRELTHAAVSLTSFDVTVCSADFFFPPLIISCSQRQKTWFDLV